MRGECSRLESNQGPPDLQSDALPTELQEPARHKPFLVMVGTAQVFLQTGNLGNQI